MALIAPCIFAILMFITVTDRSNIYLLLKFVWLPLCKPCNNQVDGDRSDVIDYSD